MRQKAGGRWAGKGKRSLMLRKKGQEEQERSWQFEGGSLFISQPDVAEREGWPGLSIDSHQS